MATSLLVHVCFVVLCFASTVLSEPAVSVVGNSMIINVGGATVSLESTDCTATGSSMTATQERVDGHASSLQASLSSSVAGKNAAATSVAIGAAAAQGAAVSSAASTAAPAVAFLSGLRAVLGNNLENVVTKSSIDTALSSIALTAAASLQATTAAATDSAAVMLQSQTSRVLRTATQFAQTSAYVDVVMNVTGASLENLVAATAADATGATISTIISSLPSTTATNTATLVAAVAPQVSTVSAAAASAMTYLNSVRASAGNNLENLATIASVNASINNLNGDISDILTTQLSTTSNLVSAITVNQTGLINANVAQNVAPLNYISALQNFSGSAVQNLVTTFTVAGQATTVRTNITTAMSTQQSTIYANLAAAVTTSITSVANSIDSQSSRLIVIDNKVGVISTMVDDIRQETALNAATLASALGALASLEASLLDLSNNHNQSFTNSTSAISTIQSTIVIEVSRASTAEAAINAANAQLSTAISTNTVRMSQMVACNAGGRVWSSSTSTCIDTIRRCNAAMNGRSRYNSASNFIEYCDGTTWQAMWNLLGATQRQFSTSCAAIYAADSQAMSGVYWIGASFAAAKQTYCQFSDDGAWVLVAMMADIEDEQWQFQSVTWTSSNTVNPTVVDPDTDVHMKNDYYNTMAFTKFKFIMTSLNSFPFKVVTTGTSLMAFMAAGTQITTSFGRARWIQATGYPSTYWDNSPNCNAEGVNLNGGASPNFYRCRLGIAFNNEGDCNTCDSGLGFGCYQNGQVASGPHRIGCGGVCFSNDGRYSRRGWIFIQQ